MNSENYSYSLYSLGNLYARKKLHVVMFKIGYTTKKITTKVLLARVVSRINIL